MSKKAAKKSASKHAKTTEQVEKDTPVTSTTNADAHAEQRVGTANQLAAIHEEARQMEGKERQATFGSTAPEEDKPDPKEEPTEITVKYRDHEGKELERTYSKAVHGPDFKVLADEFKKVNSSRIVTS